VAQGDSGDGESLEAAVKGIAMGLTGKLKEAAGELLEDPELEQQGVEQQREADEIRRTGATPAD
jgi:uncharacterized protein YjbJ (UPF0337 family)